MIRGSAHRGGARHRPLHYTDPFDMFVFLLPALILIAVNLLIYLPGRL